MDISSPKNFVDEDALYRPNRRAAEEEEEDDEDDELDSTGSRDFFEAEAPLEYPALRVKLSSSGAPPVSLPDQAILPLYMTSIEGVQALALRDEDAAALRALLPDEEVRNSVLRFREAKDSQSEGRLLTPLTLESQRLLPVYARGQSAKASVWQTLRTACGDLWHAVVYGVQRELARFAHNLQVLDAMYGESVLSEPLPAWVDPPNTRRLSRASQDKIAKSLYPIPMKGVLVRLEFLNRDLSAAKCRALIGTQVRHTPGSMIVTHFVQVERADRLPEEGRLRHVVVDFYDGKVTSDVVFPLKEFGIHVDISRREKKRGTSLMTRFWASAKFRSHVAASHEEEEPRFSEAEHEVGRPGDGGRRRRNSGVRAIREEVDEDDDEEEETAPAVQ